MRQHKDNDTEHPRKMLIIVLKNSMMGVLTLVLVIVGVSVSPTWHDSPWYQWGLHGYPEHMSTMFRAFGHWIERGVGVMLLVISGGILAYYLIPKFMQSFSSTHKVIWCDKRLMRIILWGCCIAISIITLHIRYHWNQPDTFESDPFLFGYRERIQHTVKIGRLREWVTTQGYSIDHLPEDTEANDLLLPPFMLDMFP